LEYLPEAPDYLNPENYLCEPFDDHDYPDTSIWLKIVNWIHDQVKKRKVLIHCQQGVNRSTAVIGVYLCTTYPADYPSFESALNHMRNACIDAGAMT
jgi:protein-tyrosine phosphatase